MSLAAGVCHFFSCFPSIHMTMQPCIINLGWGLLRLHGYRYRGSVPIPILENKPAACAIASSPAPLIVIPRTQLQGQAIPAKPGLIVASPLASTWYDCGHTAIGKRLSKSRYQTGSPTTSGWPSHRPAVRPTTALGYTHDFITLA